MAVCWRCPICSEVSCEDDFNAAGRPLACDACERPVLPAEALCTICESPNPWARRDTLHFICTTCGQSQTFYSRMNAAS